MREIKFNLPLEIDQSDERAVSIQNKLVLDERISVLMKKNRVGISLKPLQKLDFPPKNLTLADLRLNCVAHAHPECEFKWVRLIANFSKYDGIIIKDISPDEVIGEPVTIKTKYTGGFKFSVEQTPVKGELNVGRDREIEKQIYYPEITSSGVGFSTAYWDFREGNRAKLHVDRELRLLLEYPYLTKFVSAKLTLRAEVSVKGFLEHIPLLGRKEKEFELSAYL